LTVVILSEIIDQMMQHARREEPLECCGLLAGRSDKIDEIFCCSNQSMSQVEFSVPPCELFHAFRQIRRRGKKLLGIYHSHPSSQAVPSEKDRNEYHYHDASYWIVSLQNRSPVVRCFRWEDNTFQETQFQVLRNH
jgi:proteasome lid subunit RPN8/RPN11